MPTTIRAEDFDAVRNSEWLVNQLLLELTCCRIRPSFLNQRVSRSQLHHELCRIDVAREILPGHAKCCARAASKRWPVSSALADDLSPISPSASRAPASSWPS